MTDLDLTGATVLVVQPGERLVFVTTNADYTRQEMAECLDRLKAVLPDNEIHVVAGFDQVIKQEAADD